MEFKFRAGDHRPPPAPPALQYVPPRPPAVYCLSKPGFPDACLRRTTNIITLRKPPFDSKEEMHWEMELMRLREEKLMAEIERQRFLKEEARRELMLFEREMAIRGVAQSAVYSLQQPQRWVAPFSAAAAPSPSSCPFPPPSHSPAVVVQSFHEWQKIEQVKRSEHLGFAAVALPPRIQPLMVEDKKEERKVLEADKREFIVLEKPDPNVFREKRKAETTSTSNDDVQPSIVKKTSSKEWSCALCEVTVSNERTFNQHLRGKKHTRKEASLRAQRESKISRAASEALPKKRRKLNKAIAGTSAEGKQLKDGETLQGEKTEGSDDMNALIPNSLKLGDNEDNKQQNNQIAVEQNSTIEDDIVAKKKFNFWCGKCKVGAYDTEVMLAHVNGKKHRANLQKAGQTREGQPL